MPGQAGGGGGPQAPEVTGKAAWLGVRGQEQVYGGSVTPTALLPPAGGRRVSGAPTGTAARWRARCPGSGPTRCRLPQTPTRPWLAGDRRAAPATGLRCGGCGRGSRSCFQPGRAQVAPGRGRGSSPGAEVRSQLPALSLSSGWPQATHTSGSRPFPRWPHSTAGARGRWTGSGERPARSEDLRTCLLFARHAASGVLEPCEPPSPRL